MLLGKQQILDAQDRRHEDIAVPEWGGNVRVAMMSASDRDRWEQETYGGDTPKVDDFRARFVGLCLVDEMGGRLFSDHEVAQLGAKSAAALAFRDKALTLKARARGKSGEDIDLLSLS